MKKIESHSKDIEDKWNFGEDRGNRGKNQPIRIQNTEITQFKRQQSRKQN